MGIIGIGIGTYFGVRAWDTGNKSDENCDPSCNETGKRQADDALVHARNANIAFGAGLGALAIGAILYLTEGSPASTDTAWTVDGDPTRGEAALRFRTAF
jgi:hypothetical protein